MMLTSWLGGLVPLRGLEGGMEEEFYGVGGGGKCGWEIRYDGYMYEMDFGS